MQMLKMDLQASGKLRQYSNKQILVVGEGNFSFSLSLAKAFGSATNITATSLDIRGSKSKFINHIINFFFLSSEYNIYLVTSRKINNTL